MLFCCNLPRQTEDRELPPPLTTCPPIPFPCPVFQAWQKPILVDVLRSRPSANASGPATPPPGALPPPPPPVSAELSDASSVGAEPDTPRIADRASPQQQHAAAAASSSSPGASHPSSPSPSVAGLGAAPGEAAHAGAPHLSAAAAPPASPAADSPLERGTLAAADKVAAAADAVNEEAKPADPQPLSPQLIRRVNTPVGEINFLTGTATGEEAPEAPAASSPEAAAAAAHSSAQPAHKPEPESVRFLVSYPPVLCLFAWTMTQRLECASGSINPPAQLALAASHLTLSFPLSLPQEYVSWANDEDLESPASRHRSPYATPERHRAGAGAPGSSPLYFKPVVDSPSKDPESFLVAA